MLKMLRAVPFFRLLAIAKTVLLVRRHFRKLDARDRGRLGELVRRGLHSTPAEREELRRILAKLEPRVFAAAATDALSPVRVPGWVKRRIGG